MIYDISGLSNSWNILTGAMTIVYPTLPSDETEITNFKKMTEMLQILPNQNRCRHLRARPHQREEEHGGPVVGRGGVPLQLQRGRGRRRDRNQGQIRQVQADNLQEFGQGCVLNELSVHNADL